MTRKKYKEVWYTYKELVQVEGEKTPRLLVPWSDPNLYEYAFDFIYKTPKEARKGLTEWDGDPGWILCKMTLEVL